MPLYNRNADGIYYDNTNSNLTAENVQQAIDEIVTIEAPVYPTVIKNAQLVMDSALTINNSTGFRVNQPNGIIEMVRFIGHSTIENTGSLTITSNGSMRVVGV